VRILKFIKPLVCLIGVLTAFGCRGQKSTEPPIHLVPNMDVQEKYKAFGENPVFHDKRNMRPIPEGTIARGHLDADKAYFTGMVDSQFVSNQLPLTMELLERGRERYDIYCSVCHGLTGSGKGIIIQKGFTPAPSYHDERIINMSDGEIFNVITNGIRTMQPVKTQVPVEDRWAVTAYIRALQRSQNGTINDVPEDKQAGLK
jgi:mono/diheme cytochrome c family protein